MKKIVLIISLFFTVGISYGQNAKPTRDETVNYIKKLLYDYSPKDWTNDFIDLYYDGNTLKYWLGKYVTDGHEIIGNFWEMDIFIKNLDFNIVSTDTQHVSSKYNPLYKVRIEGRDDLYASVRYEDLKPPQPPPISRKYAIFVFDYEKAKVDPKLASKLVNALKRLQELSTNDDPFDK
jgi:hypothetical protein